MELQPDIDIFVGSNTIIDLTLYELWLKSLLPSEAVKQRKKEHKGISSDLLMSDILDQYRTLGLMEKYLKNPLTLANQLSFQLSESMRKELIIRYFRFNDAVIRELLGKKLSRSTYQSMDEISEKTGVNLRYCLRQFDNCRRVFKTVEDMPGSLVENISQQFLLPKDLSWAYATVVFLASNKFECTKRKLSHMSLNDFIVCVQQLSEHWTSSSDSDFTAGDINIDIDREFLHDLRGAKFLSSDRETIEKLKECYPGRKTEEFAATCRTLCRGIPAIGSGLYHTKDLRDLFVDIVEKIVEPAHSAQWTDVMLREFLNNFTEITNEHSQMGVIRPAWSKFMNVLNCCVIQAFG